MPKITLPDELICSITGKIFRNPVTVEDVDGKQEELVYEKSAIIINDINKGSIHFFTGKKIKWVFPDKNKAKQVVDFLSEKQVCTIEQFLTSIKEGEASQIERLNYLDEHLAYQDADGDTPLHLATRKDNKEVVKLLLENGADVNVRGKDGNTPLHLAVIRGNEDIIATLLDFKANVGIQNNDRPSSSFQEIVSQFMELCKKNPQIRAQNEAMVTQGRSPFHNMAGYVESMVGGDTPLHIATLKSHINAIRLMLRNKANVNVRDKLRQTLLHSTSKRGDEEVVKLLLENGSDVDAEDRWGETPLHWAARNGKEKVVKLLINAGANVNKQNGLFLGQTPIHLAIQRSNETIVRLLLDAGVDVNAKKDSDGCTLLHLAAEQDLVGHQRINIVKLLLAKGADKTALNNKGQTPIDIANERKYVEIAQLIANYHSNSENSEEEQRESKRFKLG